jgi:hypothetical protein
VTLKEKALRVAERYNVLSGPSPDQYNAEVCEGRILFSLWHYALPRMRLTPLLSTDTTGTMMREVAGFGRRSSFHQDLSSGPMLS